MKMTDEELELARRVADALNPEKTSTAHRLLGHIAALSAERDEAVRRERTTRESIRGTHLDMDNARCPGTNRPIEERIRLLWEERDALRERVEALEAEALRRVGEFNRDWTALRAENTAIRERAQDPARLMLKYQRGGMAAVSSYILGDAAPAPSEPSQCECEPGYTCPACSAPSEMDGLRGEMAEVSPRCGRCKYRHSVGLSCTPDAPPAEPPTAGAFAMVGAALAKWVPESHPDRETALSEFSLLVRRVGAQDAAIRAVVALGLDGPVVEQARAALTDAPLVFTPAQIEQALHSQGISDWRNGAVLRALRSQA